MKGVLTMKRSFLSALGLERDVIDRIMAEHGATVESFKERAKETEAALRQQLEDTVTERENSRTDDLVMQVLKDAGMNDAAIPIALKRYDRSIIEFCDGVISNAESLIEHFKGDWNDFFSTVEQQSAQVGTPLVLTQSGGTMNDFILAAAGKR
jgi:hypothetical protein